MLTKTMPELFFIHSDLDIVYANPMACALLGQNPQRNSLALHLSISSRRTTAHHSGSAWPTSTVATNAPLD